MMAVATVPLLIFGIYQGLLVTGKHALRRWSSVSSKGGKLQHWADRVFTLAAIAFSVSLWATPDWHEASHVMLGLLGGGKHGSSKRDCHQKLRNGKNVALVASQFNVPMLDYEQPGDLNSASESSNHAMPRFWDETHFSNRFGDRRLSDMRDAGYFSSASRLH